jgi:leucyl aminopeptidase
MRITLSNKDPATSGADTLILFAWAGRDPFVAGTSPHVAKAVGKAEAWAKRTHFRGNAGELAQFPTWQDSPFEQVVVAGLGAPSDFHIGLLRRSAGAAVRRALRAGARRIAIAAHALDAFKGFDPDVLGMSISAAIHRAMYGTVGSNGVPSTAAVTISIHNGQTGVKRRDFAAGIDEGTVRGQAINEVRALANMPGNVCSPEVVAGFARSFARKHRLACEVWDQRRLARERCHALLAVAQGSRKAPRLIVLRHPGRRKKLPPLVLVGKTITFDTGGISIKPARSMEWMRFDKSGGMAVLAAMAMVARLGSDRPVVGILAAAENMPGGNATRPGDVVRSRSGTAIEIINTDAEGRLVLADALSVAMDHKPAAVMDLATLTGAAVTALGHIVSAVMGHSAQIERVMHAGEITGDRVWPLPLYREYQEMLKTPFADIKNTGDGTAGAIAGGMFLSRFVPAGVPWVHVDLTHAWEEKEQPFSAAGANLFGAELAWEWVRNFDH